MWLSFLKKNYKENNSDISTNDVLAMLIFVPNFPLMTYYDKVFYREIILVPPSFLPVIAECLLLSTLKYSVTEGSMEGHILSGTWNGTKENQLFERNKREFNRKPTNSGQMVTDSGFTPISTPPPQQK